MEPAAKRSRVCESVRDQSAPPVDFSDDIDFTNATDPRHDVTIFIGGQKLYAGKQILSAHSAVFASMFIGERRNNKQIFLQQVNRDEILELLRVIYPSRHKITYENVLYLLQLARRFQIKMVAEEAEAHFITSTCDLATKLVFSDKHGLDKLKNHCYAALRTTEDFKAVKESPMYNELSNAAKVTFLERWLTHLVPDPITVEPAESEALNIANLPLDVIRHIINAGLESIENARLISHKWNEVVVDHLSHRHHLPEIHSFRSKDEAKYRSIKLTIDRRYRAYFGLESWPHEYKGDREEIVLLEEVWYKSTEARDNWLMNRLTRLFSKCSRIEKFILDTKSSDKNCIITKALQDIPIGELDCGILLEFRNNTKIQIMDLIQAHTIHHIRMKINETFTWDLSKEHLFSFLQDVGRFVRTLEIDVNGLFIFPPGRMNDAEKAAWRATEIHQLRKKWKKRMGKLRGNLSADLQLDYGPFDSRNARCGTLVMRATIHGSQ